MAYGLLKATVAKFVLTLYEQNQLDNDFSIKKNTARTLFRPFIRSKGTSTGWTIGIVLGCRKLVIRPKPDADKSMIFFKKANVLQLVEDKAKIDESLDGSRYRCRVCKTTFTERKLLNLHLLSDAHTFQKEFTIASTRRKAMNRLKFSIDRAPNLSNIIIRKDVRQVLSFRITNITRKPLVFVKVDRENLNEIIFDLPLGTVLNPQSTLRVDLKIWCHENGLIYWPILFTIQSDGLILKEAVSLIFHVHDATYDNLHPTVPYTRPKPILPQIYCNYIPGVLPPAVSSDFVPKFRLQSYPLPKDLIILLNHGLKIERIERPTLQITQKFNEIKSLLQLDRAVDNKAKTLNEKNYTNLLDLLLYIEEYQVIKNIRQYDKNDDSLRQHNHRLFELNVPGLAEHRPSVLLGDSILVNEMGSNRNYQGYVHKVLETSVYLAFDPQFRNEEYLPNKKFHVQFSFNRMSIKAEHQSVALAKTHKITPHFFPKKIENSQIHPSIVKITWFNKHIEKNFEQQQAVRYILQKSAMPSPYLIFGPPGTGKTVTVVEAINQIYKCKDDKILICAPSNNAANEIMKRLVNTIPKMDMIRYLSYSFPLNLVPPNVVPYCNYKKGEYYHPTIEGLMKYRIVVTTLTTASRLYNGGLMMTERFGYVFIDESGHSTESETLIAIAGILSNSNNIGQINGQIVLAGDPKQLGPIVHSPLARNYGLATSMLERLMDLDPYKKHLNQNYNPAALTKLRKNYRSHSIILNQPNKLFYADEVEVAGDNMIHIGIDWDQLPNLKFPMIFHSVLGVNQREKDSPSFFNLQEVEVVLEYLEKLMGTKMKGYQISGKDIGIISPYRKQVEKITMACTKKNYSNIIIGSVEQLQGQERLIIILSTVRSNPEYLQHDKKFNLGFLDNPKRMNVAITRAKALLIIVGSPDVLLLDEYWKSLILFCVENKAVVGKPFTLEKIESFDTKFESPINDEDFNAEDGPDFSRGII